MDRKDTDNIIHLKHNPKEAKQAKDLADQIRQKEPEIEVKMEANDLTKGVEARWWRGTKTFVLYLPSDGSFDKLFTRLEGLKNM